MCSGTFVGWVEGGEELVSGMLENRDDAGRRRGGSRGTITSHCLLRPGQELEQKRKFLDP